MKRRLGLLLSVLILIVAAAGCSAAVQVTPVVGADRDTVLSYSESKTDNLMAAFNADDYTTFSRDFDDAMKQSINTATFPNLKQKVAVIGKYITRQVDRVEETGSYVAVVYNAKFENEDPVTLRVVFMLAEPHSISGLFFDSAKLRNP
jgi:hypothetical protein